MVLPSFNRETLKNRLLKLDDKKKLAFGAICCKRLLPNYLAFQRDENWGKFSDLQSVLDFIWSSCIEMPERSKSFSTMIETCELISPSSDDFESLYVTSAQEACFSVCSLLDYLYSHDIEHIIQVANYATDTVDLYVQEMEQFLAEDPNLEQKILAHPLMQRELMQQQDNLKYLENACPWNHNTLNKLKNSWNNNGKSNLDIPYYV